MGAHVLDGPQNLADGTQRQALGLEGDENEVRDRESRSGHEAHTRRGVEHRNVEGAVHLAEGLLEDSRAEERLLEVAGVTRIQVSPREYRERRHARLRRWTRWAGCAASEDR